MGTDPRLEAVNRKLAKAQQQLADLKNEVAEDRLRLAETMACLEGVVTHAHSLGMPEAKIAKICGVSRMTVRKWLGK